LDNGIGSRLKIRIIFIQKNHFNDKIFLKKSQKKQK